MLARAGASLILAMTDRTTGDGTRLLVLRLDGTLDHEVASRLPFLVVSLACLDETRCVAIAADVDRGIPLRVVRLRTDGTVLADDTLDGVMAPERPRLVATPTGVLIDRGGSDFTPVDFESGLGAPFTVASPVGGSYGAVACGPSDCLFVWSQISSMRGLYAQRFMFSGVPIGAPITLLTASTGTLSSVAVEHAGVSYAVLLSTGAGLEGFRLLDDGTSVRRTLSSSSRLHPMACNANGVCLVQTYDSGTLVGWSSMGSATITIGSIGTSASGVAATGAPRFVRCSVTDSTVELFDIDSDDPALSRPRPSVGTGPDLHAGPVAVAGGDRGYVAVFHRATETGWELVSQTLDAMGRPRPTVGTVLRAMAQPADRVVLVAAGAQFGLVTLEAGAAVLMRLTRDGTPDGAVVPLGTGRHDVDLAWNGTHFLTLVTDASNMALAQRFDAIGQRVDATPVALRGVYDATLASDGDNFLFVFASLGGVRAQRLTADLSPLDAGGFLVRDQPTEQLAAGFDGSQYLVAWSEGTTSFEPRVARITPGAEVLDVGGVSLAPSGPSLEVALAPRRGQSYVAWASTTAGGDRSVWISTFTSEGMARPAMSVSHESQSRGVAGLAIAGETYGAVVFARMMRDPEHIPLRIRATPIADDGSGTGCTVDAECSTGHCVAGVCCDSACDNPCESCGSGRCEVAAAGVECRPSAGDCDLPETCDGASVTCPPPLDTACVTDASTSGMDAAVPTTDAGGITSPPSSCAVGGSSPGWPLVVLALLAVRRRHRPSREQRPRATVRNRVRVLRVSASQGGERVRSLCPHARQSRGS